MAEQKEEIALVGLENLSDEELADIVRSSEDEYSNDAREIALKELALRSSR